MPQVLEKWLLCLLLGTLVLCGPAASQSTKGAGIARLPQAAYAWQRDWDGGVRAAVAEHGAAFENLVALAAEVSWDHGQPQVTHVAVDYNVLKEANTRAGLALRIGPYSGLAAKQTNALGSLAAALVAEAKGKGLTPGELQIDYDCAESKLDGYRDWVMAIKSAVAPVPVVITTLPSWLKQPDFRPLIAAADGYVLQVHSLERPAGIDAPFTLCDPVAARAAVEQAGRLGVPFRVALPTYGYLLAFSADGRFIGLSAEGPAKSWPADVKLREVRSDALAMAELVRGWDAQRPAALPRSYMVPAAGGR